MRAAVLYGDYNIRYEEFAEPELKPGCVKIKVCACGVCGSDIPRITQGGAHYYPIVLGHEFSGYVVDAAEDVTNVQIGDHVAAVPLIPCLKCEDCKAGHFSLCKNYTFIGSRIQGGYADYVVVPSINAVKIENHISYEEGAMLEPATVALHGIRQAKYEEDGHVLIIGGGTIGAFALQWIKKLGAKSVTVLGRDVTHLNVSKELGADNIVSVYQDDYRDCLDSITNGKGFDYIFEAAGADSTIKLGFELVLNHGCVCLIGTPTGTVQFSQKEWELINRKEFYLTGSWMSSSVTFPGDEWEYTAQCLAEGSVKLIDGMICKKIQISNTLELIETLKEKNKIKGRIILTNY